MILKYILVTYLLTSLLYCFISLNSRAYALSPSFSNQELTDEAFKWIDINEKRPTATGDPSIDIRRVDYLSDGKTLNSTFWLSGPIKISNDSTTMAYGMVIDVDDNEKTGVQGVDYQIEVKSQNGTWTKSFIRWSSLGQPQILSLIHSDIGFFEKGKPYVSLSADLAALGFPGKYKVMFYTEERSKDGSRWIADFTELVRIPPPDISILITPRSLSMRRGEEKVMKLDLRSNIKETNAQVIFSVNQTNSFIGAAIFSNEAKLSSDGSADASLHLKVTNDAIARPYVVPINGTVFFPSRSTFETRSSGNSHLIIPASLKNQNITKESSVGVNVLEPLTASEEINRFYLTFSGVIGVIVSLVVGIFAYYIGFTRFSRVKNMYRRKIDALYNSSLNNREEALKRLREIRMEIMEILDKGNIRHKDYETLNKKVLQYIDKISTSQM